MSRGTGKFRRKGKPATTEEVLQKLGDPSEWIRHERQSEFHKHLRPGDKDLDIAGIRGSVGKGYLGYLKESLENPLGSNTRPVSEEENTEIRRVAREEIPPLIERYEQRLRELEKVPGEIHKYIEVLAMWLHYRRSFRKIHPESEPTEKLRQFARQLNEENDRQIKELEDLSMHYAKLLLGLWAESASPANP
jgi:hypothetical protein